MSIDPSCDRNTEGQAAADRNEAAKLYHFNVLHDVALPRADMLYGYFRRTGIRWGAERPTRISFILDESLNAIPGDGDFS